MKKYLVIGLIFAVIIGFFSLNHDKVYGIVIDETEQSKEEIIELSLDEKDFFDKMKMKQQYESEGYLVVDTINGTNKETIEMDGVEYEKDALIYSIYKASQNGELDLAIRSYENQMSFSNRNSLYKIQEKANQGQLRYNDIKPLIDDNKFIEEGKSLFRHLIPNRIIIDSRDYNLMTSYFYTTIYTGYFENFTTNNTSCGIYNFQAEYYVENNQTIFTGAYRYALATQYGTYDHITSFQFSYQSYSGLLGTTPEADITVIIDYWGQQKMILSSSVLQYDFKISRNMHYDRNEYNKSNNQYVNVLYSTETSLPTGVWTKQPALKSYFHKLLPENADNTKYTLEDTYFDLNENITYNGSFELVYDGEGNVLNETQDYLVLFTYNLGVEESNPEPGLANAHYIRDVYPYLVWGNTKDDYNEYSAFERFVWDKASWNVIYGGTARNASGETLTNMYPSPIGNSGGLCIPTQFINNPFGWTMYFDYIEDQEIHEDNFTNIDWSTFIINVYTETPGVVTKFEDEDNVNYNNPGVYSVTVGIRDSNNNEITQTFHVTVLHKVVVPSC